MKSASIPFWVAVIININIVIGSAFFLGAQSINANSGLLAPLSWLVCALLLAPLVAVFAKFSRKYPEAGGLYVYSEKTLGKFWGFLSGWGYFIGTAAGNAAVVHAFSTYVQEIAALKPWLVQCGIYGWYFDGIIVVVFSLLNLLNITFLEGAQIFFVITKFIPIIVIVLGGLLLGSSANITTATASVPGFFGALPMVLFAFIGVEACCAVGDKIKDGKNKADRAIWTSFIIITAIYVLLQGFILVMQGQVDINPFMNVLPQLFGNHWIAVIGNKIIYGCILLSFLGGFYGMFFYNNWNLYAIAKAKNIMGHQYLSRMNKNDIPWLCVLFQGVTILLLLFLTTRDHYLVTMSDFGVVVSYLLTAISFVVAYKNITGIFALVGCLSLTYLCTSGLITAGAVNIIPFLIILGLGVLAYGYKQANT